MRYFDEFDDYIERLLLVQYDASEIIKHNLTKGEVREDFVKEQIRHQFQYISYHKGLIIDDKSGFQSGQLDVIVTKNNVRNRRYGGHSLVDLEDAEMVIEIKSCAITRHLRELDKIAEEVKLLKKNSNIKVGMFCYSYAIREQNMLKKFGYKYDKDIQGYHLDEATKNEFNNIDFVLAFDGIQENEEYTEDFFIIKDVSGNYILYKDKPVSKYFFRLFKNL